MKYHKRKRVGHYFKCIQFGETKLFENNRVYLIYLLDMRMAGYT